MRAIDSFGRNQHRLKGPRRRRERRVRCTRQAVNGPDPVAARRRQHGEHEPRITAVREQVGARLRSVDGALSSGEAELERGAEKRRVTKQVSSGAAGSLESSNVLSGRVRYGDEAEPGKSSLCDGAAGR